MPAYSFNGRTILELLNRFPAEGDPFDLYFDASNAFGPALPFILTRDGLAAFPYEELGCAKILPSDLSPLPGEMWVVFCFREQFRQQAPEKTLLRTDGFMLVLEWRKGQGDSPLLSSAFHNLAETVRKQQQISGWGLHPSQYRYQDKVDFTDRDLFADDEHVTEVASAYGALSAGLVCAEAAEFPKEWAFPTIQWDPDLGRIAGVAGLEQKLPVIADCGGRVVAVALEQVPSAENHLARLKARDAARFGALRIRGVKVWKKFGRQARAIAFCADRERRRALWLAGAGASALVATGALAWGLHESARRQTVERDQTVARAASLLVGPADNPVFESAADGLKLLASHSDDPDVRRLLLNQLRLRSWLLPEGVDATRRLTFDPQSLQKMLKETDDVIAAAEAVLADKEGRLAQMPDPPRVKVPEKWPIEYRTISGWLSARRKDTGKTLWEAPKGSQISDGEILADDDLMLVRSFAPEFAVKALDAFRGNVVWSRPTGTMLKDAVTSPDGRLWALLSQDGRVSVLSTKTGRTAFETVRVGPGVQKLEFSPDVTRLYLIGTGPAVVCRLCPSRMLVEIERPGDQLLDWHLTEGGTRIEQCVQILVSEAKMAELSERFNRGEKVSPDELASHAERQVYDLKTARVVTSEVLPEIGPAWEPQNEKLGFAPPHLSERWKRIASVGWAFGTRLTREVVVCDGEGRKLWSTVPYATPGVIPFDVDASGRILAIGVANDEVQLFDPPSGKELSTRWKLTDGAHCIVCADMAGEPLLFVGGGANDAIKDGPGYFSLYDMKLGVKCFERVATRYRIKRAALDADGNLIFDNGDGRAVSGLMRPKKDADLTAEEIRLVVEAMATLSRDESKAEGLRELFAKVGIAGR